MTSGRLVVTHICTSTRDALANRDFAAMIYRDHAATRARRCSGDTVIRANDQSNVEALHIIAKQWLCVGHCEFSF